MYPLDSVVGCDSSHSLWQVVRLRHHKVIKHRDNIALGLQGAVDLFVDPVLLLVVPHTSIHGVGRAHQDEVARGSDVLQQVVVELASLEANNVQED